MYYFNAQHKGGTGAFDPYHGNNMFRVFVNPRLIKHFSLRLNSDFKKDHCVDIRTLQQNTCIRIDTL
jgi:hypothetical protein